MTNEGHAALIADQAYLTRFNLVPTRDGLMVRAAFEWPVSMYVGRPEDLFGRPLRIEIEETELPLFGGVTAPPELPS